MGVINGLLTGLFEILFWPFRGLHPFWGLTVFSLVTGVLMLWIFGKVSDQSKIKIIRDRIRGHLIAIRLFGDDLGLLFRLQGRLLKDNAIFLKHAFVPILIMIVPVIFILIQLDLRFTHRPLLPGETTVVKVKLRDASLLDGGVSLQAPKGITIETPAVRARAAQEVAWRVRADEAGSYSLEVRAGDQTVTKDLRVGEGWARTSILRTGGGVLDKILHPGESTIPSGAVESIAVQYRPLPLRLFGWDVHWVLVFFVLSIASGFALRGTLGVEI